MEQSHKAKITLSLIAASFAVLASLMVAQAFTGPDNPGGVGAGAVSSDTANNVTVGREQTIGSTKLSVVATSTSASNYAFQVFQPNLTSIFWVRNDGEVSIPGALTVGTFTGVSNAGNISSGEFGANTGGGNYSFPASVSIGTAASSAPLHVYRATSGDNLQLALFNKQGTGYGSAYITVQDGSGITQIESNSGGSGPFRFGSYADSVISNPYVGAGPYGSIHLATAGTTRLTVMGGTGATAGYVGIGDTTPSTKLDVSHSVNGFSGIRVNNPNSGGSTTSGIEFYNASNNMARLYSERATNHLVIQNQQGVGNILFKVNAGAITALTLNNDGTGVFVGDLSVPDDSYAAGWDGSLEVPTKNAVFDKIEAGNGVTTAGNVSSGEFGSNTGGGNYTFPTSVKLGPGVGTDSTAGLWWNNSATDYSITRTAGTWSSPNYQQLNIKFGTGIILDPGGSYGKSYVEIPRGGLRVTGGKVGIGTSSPTAELQVISTDTINGAFRIGSSLSSTQIFSTWLHEFGTTGGSGFSYNIYYDGGYKYRSTGFGSLHTNLSGGNFDIRTASSGTAGAAATLTSRLYVANGGNVGIGDTTPSYKLEVAGTGNFTGALTVPDEAYAAGWNSSLEVPTKNALYDKIESLGGTVVVNANNISSGSFGANTGGGNYTFPADVIIDLTTLDSLGDGSLRVSNANGYIDIAPKNSGGAHIYTDRPGGFYFNQAIHVGVNTGQSRIYAYAPNPLLLYNSSGQGVTIAPAGATGGFVGILNASPSSALDVTGNAEVSGTLTVADDAYAAGWNSSLQVPTKNALYDKIESLGSTVVVNAGNVSSGSFGSNTGGGNYTFPADIIGSSGTQLQFASTSEDKILLYSTSYGIGISSGETNWWSGGKWSFRNNSRLGNEVATISSAGALQIDSNLTVSGAAASLFGGPVLGANGTALLPAFAFSSDPNSGFYNISNDNIGFSTAGSQRLVINQSGNVGIGTSPTSKLHVASDSGILNVQIAADTDNNNELDVPKLTLTGDGGASGIILGSEGAAGVTFTGSLTNTGYISTILGGFQIATGNSARFIVDGSGNVGIGDTTPTFKLDVAGTGRFTGDVTVPDEAYGAGWNGSTEVPTKNALYDKIELGGGTTNAANVSSGSFGANTGGGNYTFPADVTVQGKLVGGIGAVTTGGTTDWNHISNITSGQGHTLLLGSATNGPGVGGYWHPFNFEYSSKDGTGNVTQLAIPYRGSESEGIQLRTKYAGGWASWVRLVTEQSSNLNFVGGVSVPDDPYAAGWNASLQVPTKNAIYDKIESLGGGTVTAGNVSSGDFGSNTGGGNYSFPANVGIGTTSPNGKLAVEGTTGQLQTVIGDAGFGTTYAGLSVQGTLTTANYSLLGDGSLLLINRPTGGDILFRENNGGTADLTIKSGGNVGIGVSPTFKLDVGAGSTRIAGPSGSVGTTPYTLSLQNNTTSNWFEILNNGGAGKGVFFGISGNDFYQYNWQGGAILFYTSPTASSGTERLRIANNGDVSIGTATGGYKLNVAGTGNFTGDITVPDEVYGAGWNGSFEVPTKNAVYDQIETLGGSTVAAANVSSGAFGANTGGGNYTFPGTISASQTTGSERFGASSSAGGTHSTAFGSSANAANIGANAIGYTANASANYTLAIGYAATAAATGGQAIGYSSQGNGAYSLAYGYNAHADTSYAIAIGNGAAANTATHTAAIGGSSVSTGYLSQAIGYGANASATGAHAIGYSAAASSNYAQAIGYDANAIGSYAQASGYRAKAFGTSDITIGRDAGYYTTVSGGSNVVIGYRALFGTTSGSDAGTRNIAIGQYALYNRDSGGVDNVGIGYYALRVNDGNYNVALGRQTGYNNVSGNNNTLIGYQAGYNNTGSTNVFIGNQAGYSETGSNLLYIDNSNTASPLIWGDFSANLARINGDLEVNDDVYAAGWNGSTEVPTKNAVYDKIETIGGGGGGGPYPAADVSSGSFGANTGAGNYTFPAKLTVNTKVITSRYGSAGTYSASQVQGIWSIGDAYQIDTALDDFGTQYGLGYTYSTNGGGPFSSQHTIVFTNNGTINAAISLTDGRADFSSVTVNDQAYAAGWNGSTQVPTKNAVYDKIESLGGGGGGGCPCSAADISSGSFGANTGGGNYTFPADLLVTSEIRGANGTAAAPSFSFTSDTNTGIWRATTDALAFSTAGAERVRIDAAGDFGIGTTNPTSKLHVSGTGNITGTLAVGGTLTVGGGTGKINVGTIDPIYTINGEKFATYMAGMIGVKEEVAGVVQATCKRGLCEYEVNFDKEKKGSDLWLFGKVTNIKKHMDETTILLTPAFDGRVSYRKEGNNKIIFVARPEGSQRRVEISYRLTAPRFDAESWTNRTNDEASGFIINDK